MTDDIYRTDESTMGHILFMKILRRNRHIYNNIIMQTQNFYFQQKNTEKGKSMNKDKDFSGCPDANDSNKLGLEEHMMLLALTGPQPRLRYSTEMLSMLNGSMVEKYIVPDADKAKVFSALYPFENKPQLDQMMLDIHSYKRFFVRDYIVVREGDGNFIVSPYYAEAGGTVLDWMPVH